MLKRLLIVLSLLTLAALAVQPAYADSSLHFALPQDAAVVVAVAGAYAPSPVGGQSLWEKSICTEMSAGGCAYFKANEASMLWQKSDAIEGSTATFDSVVANLADGSQVWKLTVTIFTQSATLQDTVFVHVVKDDNGRWVLNRILYGPCIQTF